MDRKIGHPINKKIGGKTNKKLMIIYNDAVTLNNVDISNSTNTSRMNQSVCFESAKIQICFCI